MTKRFIQDNRGQVLYAVIITIMFVGLLSMIAMGLTLKNYQAAQVKQQHVTDYYVVDAVAELIRIEQITLEDNTKINVNAETFGAPPDGEPQDGERLVQVTRHGATYTITYGTVTLETQIDAGNKHFMSWEVSYHAVQTEAEDEQPSN